MQYKYFVSALFLLAAHAPLQAQQHSKTAGAHKIKAAVSKSDTLVANTIIKTPVAGSSSAKPSSLLASNLPAEGIAADKKNLYLHVPLAGEKAYFGEKNEYVNDYVRKYLEVHNKTLGSVQNNSIEPFSVMDNVLEKKQLPKELKYLAVIESALKNNAVSHAGAVGPWQLMESTARMMGLSVNRHRDDRRDWYKSTAAATKYLELLYSQLNDWLLVIAAYNSGPTPVQKAIAKTGSHNFWDIKEYLPHETQGHVLAFIATASIFENLSKFIDLGSVPVDFKFGKDDEPLPAAVRKDIAGKPIPVTIPTVTAVPAAQGAAPIAGSTVNAGGTASVALKKLPYTEEELKQMTIVRIKEPISMDFMAQELNIDKKLLARWNPDYEMYLQKTYPTPFYNLRLPKDKQDAFIAKKDELTRKSKAILQQTAK